MPTALAVAAVAPDVDVLSFPHTGPIARGPRTATLVIRVTGPVVVPNRDKLKHLIEDELHDGRRRIVLDLEHCGYLDASALGVLVSVTKVARKAGALVILTELNQDLETLLTLTKMTEVLNVDPRLADALTWPSEAL